MTAKLTKLTPLQKSVLDALAPYPDGLPYDQIKHYGNMVIPSLTSAHKPYVMRVNAYIRLTDAGRLRQQNKLPTPRKVETVGEIAEKASSLCADLIAYPHTDAPTLPYRDLLDEAAWAYQRLHYRTVNTAHWERPRKAMMERIIARVKSA